MKRFLFFFTLAVIISCKEKERKGLRIQEGDGFLLSGPVYVDINRLGERISENSMLLQNGKPVPFQIKDEKGWFIHDPREGNAYDIVEVSDRIMNLKANNILKNNGNLQLLSGEMA